VHNRRDAALAVWPFLVAAIRGIRKFIKWQSKATLKAGLHLLCDIYFNLLMGSSRAATIRHVPLLLRAEE
jgi:hypothetical protein